MRRGINLFYNLLLVQEQNHMIEGVSTGVAALRQMVGDHRAEVSRFVSSAGPVLDKVDTWVEDWQVYRDTYVDCRCA